MTLSEKLLEKLSDDSVSEGLHKFTVTAADTNVDITADSNTALACSVWEFSVTRPAPVGLTVRQWADRIAASVSGLREDLRVHEVDTETNVALLRSDCPSKRGSRVAYYEVRLDGVSRATVQRFEAETKTAAPRNQVSFPLTHEVLVKLVDDIAN